MTRLKEVERTELKVRVKLEGELKYANMPLISRSIEEYILNGVKDLYISIDNPYSDQRRQKEYERTSQIDFDKGLNHIIGSKGGLAKVISNVKRLLGLNVSVLIQGESGTGKDVIARAIHDCDPMRKMAPFIAVNCAAIPENLVEAELFGHHKGAFTGATEMRDGYFQRADGGTLFLDEVGELPLTMQSKLLRVLQDKRVRRIGSYEEKPVDVRVLAATNVDMDQAVSDGRFRTDLYYRLEEYPLYIPPLRQRRQDIIPLVQYFLAQFCKELDKPFIKSVSQAAIAWFEKQDWSHNNVRELRKVLKSAMIDCDEEVVDLRHLRVPKLVDAKTIKSQLQHIESRQLEETLMQTKGNIAAAARLLKMSRSTLYDRLKKLGINSNRL